MSKEEEFAVAFRKVILAVAPPANTKMAKETTPTILLADWGRKACDILEARTPDKELVWALEDCDEQICMLCKRLNPQHESCEICGERKDRLELLSKYKGKN